MKKNIIYICLVALFFGSFTIVFDTFARPKVSELEKRELASFPDFTWEKLTSGEFTKEVSSWFSDSEPYRDELMTFSMQIKDLIGFNPTDDNIKFHAGDTPLEPNTEEGDSVSVNPDMDNDDESMDELSALVETAGGSVEGIILQNRPSPDPRTFIGEGKAEEVRLWCENVGATMVIFDNDLSPSQMRVLTELLKVQVLDRCGLILDIFAQRARTREGRLQVELAQYRYLLPRLTGMWTHLERQAGTSGRGPIGSKGPGETQLETDRRHIRRKIDKLKADLEDVRRVRGTQRRTRERREIPVAAIVGYTNAGKSTLLNRLTGSTIPANDRLFDTLDTRSMSWSVTRWALSENCHTN